MTKQSPIEANFSESYREAREKFLKTAKAAEAEIFEYVHPNKGRYGETLAIDCALLGSPRADNVLIVSSGCHGVEGYCGSGIQIHSLQDTELAQLALRAGVSVLYLHALNPHGFSFGRRVNEDNIDLNRNFQNFSLPLPSNPAYRELHHLLLPQKWPPRIQNHFALLTGVIKRGPALLQQAVTSGQYEFSDGMFFGGQCPAWSNTTLRQILLDHVGNARHIAWIDLHTGLGPQGHGERIFSAGNDPENDYRRAQQWWGSQETPVTRTELGESSSAILSGTMNAAARQECPTASLTLIALEFGTLGKLDVLQALRADHWKHNNPNASKQLAQTIERQMLAAFYVDAPEWKMRVTSQARDAIGQAIEGLSKIL